MTAALRRPSVRLRAGAVCAAVVLLAAVTLAGCDGTSRPKPSATALPEGISATLAPSAAPGQVLVVFDNDAAEPLVIRSLRVDDARFRWAGRPTSPRDRTVGGMTVSLVPVALPDAQCDAAEGEGTRLTVQYSLGASTAVASSAIADPARLVASFTTAACGG